MYEIKMVERKTHCLINKYETEIENDNDLFRMLGRLSLYCWLELDSSDYKDADWSCWGAKDGSDRLCAFTALKKTDTPEGPHRHGLPTGILARGKATNWYGEHVDVDIIIEIKEEAK